MYGEQTQSRSQRLELTQLNGHISHMKDEAASKIVVVRVLMTDTLIEGQPTVQLWAAALPRDEAARAVQRAIPSRWIAELTDQELTPEHVARLRMAPGTVAELSSARS